MEKSGKTLERKNSMVESTFNLLRNFKFKFSGKLFQLIVLTYWFNFPNIVANNVQ